MHRTAPIGPIVAAPDDGIARCDSRDIAATKAE